MRVGRGIAVTGEMLRGHQNARFRIGVRAFDEADDELRDVLRIFAVRADVDDGVVGVIVDIGIGEEEPLDAHGARFLRRDFAFDAGFIGIARRGEGHGVREDRGGVDAHGSAALEIAGHQQRHFRQTLHAIDEARGFQRIGLRHDPAVRDVDQNQAADVFLRDQVDEFAILSRARIATDAR